MTTEAAQRRAENLKVSTAETSHHEAGHAVAAVHRGGRLDGISVHASLLDDDPDDDHPNGNTDIRARHESDMPFILFAGKWSVIKWQATIGPGDILDFVDDNIVAAVDVAWREGDWGYPSTDYESYLTYVTQLEEFAEELGLGLVGRAWEYDWADELETLWPVIRQVAMLLLNDEPVTHETIEALLAELPDPEDAEI
jgi:hypothetical protein